MAPRGAVSAPVALKPPERVERVTTLRLALGDLQVAALKLRVWEDARHFTELPTAGLAWDEPPDLPAALDGTLTRAQPVATRLPRFAWGRRYFRYVARQYALQTVDLTRSFDHYVHKFSPKTRATLRRKVRRVAVACGGNPDVREYRTPTEFEQFHVAALAVSARTYQARLLGLGLPSERHFVETARALAAEDRLRGYLLFVEQLPVAYLLCTARDAVVFYDHVGHDPDFAFLSPGTVLLYHVLERLMSEGRWRMLDFTAGEAPHKSLFATDAVRCADIFCLRRTWRLVAAARLHALAGDVSTGLGAALHSVGLKSRIKKWLRGAAC